MIDTAITPENVAYAKKLKEIVEDCSIPPDCKGTVFHQAYVDGEIKYGDKYRSDFWLQFLELLQDDYFDALNHGCSFVDGYTIDDLFKLLLSTIDDLLNNKMPSLDNENYYYHRTAWYFLDEEFSKNKYDINYMTATIKKYLNRSGIEELGIEYGKKRNRIIIDNKRGHSIIINKKHIHVKHKKYRFIASLDEMILYKEVFNETTFNSILESILKSKKMLVKR